MWVYSGESLRSRLALDRKLGFWLDYWLFLHADDTHPVWCSRPLGIRTLADLALKSENSHVDRELRKVLIDDVRTASSHTPRPRSIPQPPANPLPVASPYAWPSSWLQWFRDIERIDVNALIDDYITVACDALEAGHLSTAAFLTSQLSAELGSDYWSRGQLFNDVRGQVCDSGQFADRPFIGKELATCLREILLTRSEVSYEVTFHLTPTRPSAEAVKAMESSEGYRAKVIMATDAELQQILVGLTISVRASHPHLAMMKALSDARNSLEGLRLRYYRNAHIYGLAEVHTEAEPEKVTYLLLPQPLWRNKGGRRAVPVLPMNMSGIMQRLPTEERNRWLAARWHLSEGFSDWSEDVHAASAKIWQALESFAPRNEHGRSQPLASVLSLVQPYLLLAPTDMAELLAVRFTSQRKNLVGNGYYSGSDWYYWNKKARSLDAWINCVLNPASDHHYSHWTHPPAPEVMFERDVGLLQIMARKLLNPSNEPWMESRIRNDLALLYGLRNRVVHQGSRPFSYRMAEYLGRLGAEIILALMNATPSGDGRDVTGAHDDEILLDEV